MWFGVSGPRVPKQSLAPSLFRTGGNSLKQCFAPCNRLFRGSHASGPKTPLALSLSIFGHVGCFDTCTRPAGSQSWSLRSLFSRQQRLWVTCAGATSLVSSPKNFRESETTIKIKFAFFRGGGQGAERKIFPKRCFSSERHDNKILKVKILLSRNFVVMAQAPRIARVSVNFPSSTERDVLSERPYSLESRGNSGDSRDFRDSSDPFSGKAPFVMTPSSSPCTEVFRASLFRGRELPTPGRQGQIAIKNNLCLSLVNFCRHSVILLRPFFFLNFAPKGFERLL